MKDFEVILCATPGKANDAYHYIHTSGNPVRVPPRCFPAHDWTEVMQQLEAMLDLGIITHDKSHWMAPSVFMPKKSGQLRIWVDYRELNKCTTYQGLLSTTIAKWSARQTSWVHYILYTWFAHAVDTGNCSKSSGQGENSRRLNEFCRVPFGMACAPSSFQHLMDKVLQGLPYITIYLDDILVHSDSVESHTLRVVF